MGGNGAGNVISRRAFLGVGGAMLLGTACGGNPTTAPQGPSDSSRDPLVLQPARVNTVPLQQQGTLEFQASHLIDMPSVPAPAGVFVSDSEARVVSARDMGGLPGMNGLFRFALPGANSTLAIDIGAQNQSYLSDVVLLPDNSLAITAADGFYHNSTFKAFPAELRESGVTLFPGAAVFMGEGDAGVLWVAVSPFSRDNFMNHQDPYLGAMLLAYPVISGDVDADAVEIIPLSGQNATAIGLRNVAADQQLLVLNSGNYLSSAAPYIDLISTGGARHLGSIELPTGATMQTSQHLAVSDDGQHAFLGTADESGKVLKVGIQSGSVVQTMVEAAGFHSSVVLNGGFVYVTSHGVERSSITVLDAAQFSHITTLDLESGKAGLSAAYAGGVIQLLPHRAVFIDPVEV